MANPRSDLSNNQLSGTIPSSIDNLTNLQHLCVGPRSGRRGDNHDACSARMLRGVFAGHVRRTPAVS